MKNAHAVGGSFGPAFEPIVSPSSTRVRLGSNLFSGATIKLVADLFLAAIMLVILAPVLAAISIAVASDGGPVLFRHTRIGRDGKPFECLKFRSMRRGADELLANRLANDPAAREEWLHTQKLKDDPRVTRVGRFLRSSSLDELPQILNVLKLDMSLVGPRPVMENELPRYGRNVGYYLRVRPGVTGLWQVSGRSNTTYSRRVALDAWYVKNWQPWLDVAILFRTIGAVARRDGAH